MSLGEQLRAHVQRKSGVCDVLARDGVALRGGGQGFLGLVRVHGEPAEEDLGLAARVGQLFVGQASTMVAIVIRELENRATAILDRVSFDFVLSVGEHDELACDSSWVVNHVSCRPFGAAHLVG